MGPDVHRRWPMIAWRSHLVLTHTSRGAAHLCLAWSVSFGIAWGTVHQLLYQMLQRQSSELCEDAWAMGTIPCPTTHQMRLFLTKLRTLYRCTFNISISIWTTPCPNYESNAAVPNEAPNFVQMHFQHSRWDARSAVPSRACYWKLLGVFCICCPHSTDNKRPNNWTGSGTCAKLSYNLLLRELLR